jgi:3-hydroxymyristoyl/3-hydroxydecanoyl-(acyl carrier protein) dehydratase
MTFCIDSSHPALPGHFPGNPLVPGVVILRHVLDAVEEQLPGWRVAGIRKLKFLRPLLPGQTCEVLLGEIKADRVRFRCLDSESLVAEGNLSLEPVSA